jgi:hypothetical protein
MDLQISMPKSGTYLFGYMTQCETGITTLRSEAQSIPVNQFLDPGIIAERLTNLNPAINYRAHLPNHESYIDKLSQFRRVILILRDPRDVINSHAHYVYLHPRSPLNYFHDGNKRLNEIPFSRRIDYLITNLRPVFYLFEAWRKMGIETFYYEQYKTAPLDLFDRFSKMGYGTPAEISARSNRRGMSYRAGGMGEWKQTFTSYQKRACKNIYGDLIESWK